MGAGRLVGSISRMAKQELLATTRDRYQAFSKVDNSRNLSEFTAVADHHRKHGIRLLAQSEGGLERVRAWEASDCLAMLRAAGAISRLSLPVHLLDCPTADLQAWPVPAGSLPSTVPLGCTPAAARSGSAVGRGNGPRPATGRSLSD